MGKRHLSRVNDTYTLLFPCPSNLDVRHESHREPFPTLSESEKRGGTVTRLREMMWKGRDRRELYDTFQTLSLGKKAEHISKSYGINGTGTIIPQPGTRTVILSLGIKAQIKVISSAPAAYLLAYASERPGPRLVFPYPARTIVKFQRLRHLPWIFELSAWT